VTSAPDTFSASRLSRARTAVGVCFFVNAVLYANVVPRLPEVKSELGLSNSSLGAAIAAMPLGALVAGLSAAALMRREGIAGSMVNILSQSAHGGQPFIAAYCGSKGALATLTKNAAFSLMPWRIRVNGLAIGWMATPGEDRIMRAYHGAGDGWLEEAAARQPFGRLIDPEEVARACAYLGSDESGLMTGAMIDFDQSVPGCYESAPHPKPAASPGIRA